MRSRITGIRGAAALAAITAALVLPACTAVAQTQAAMNRQAGNDFARADGEMNAAYRKLKGTLSARQQSLLITAQRAWLTFRDAETTLLSSGSEGGTMYTLLLLDNKTKLTRQRTRQLRDAYRRFTAEGRP